MIDEIVKIHDKNSAEIKVGFVARKKQKHNFFSLNFWMYIPNSLDINRFTYSKDDFYRDMKSNIRLITPVYILRDLAEGDHSAFIFLEKSFNNLASQRTRTHIADFEYQIKMFLSILKSSLREEIAHILQAPEADLDYLVYNFQHFNQVITGKYRDLYRIINVPTIDKKLMDYFRFGDEFMSNTIEYHTFRLMQGLDKRDARIFKQYKADLTEFVNKEINYKKEKKFPIAGKENRDANNELVYRLGMLKKYAESHLFLNIDKRKDGVVTEQLLYSLAAGISMVFATVIAFSVQQKFGNYTMPLFVALVVSYMLKDRIKDFARYYFAHKMGSRYYDHKISMNINRKDIGWAKESMDFISINKVPDSITKCRNNAEFFEQNNPTNKEKVLLFRTRMYINREKLDTTSDYSISGINSIIRLNLLQLMRNMDNADFPLFCPDPEHGFDVIYGEKLYYINIVVEKINDEQKELKRYRLSVNSKGIQQISPL